MGREKFYIIAPSHWIGNCARNSILFQNKKINVISNCIDHERYKPVDKFLARDLFRLPQDKKLILFGASKERDEDNLDIKEHYLGKLMDDISLNLLYSAVDVFVAPSLQDNLPNTIVESLATGTPCVAFNIGGMSDLISSELFGSLVDKVDLVSLAGSIVKSLQTKHKQNVIAKNSFMIRNENCIAQEYDEVYKFYINQNNE
ncbi:MAG: glycosyltransferase [Symbiopectobacterium sp.]|uniref:glycosyltransferase n=1 Tax=Symbiopectobacterium sp. TaxID=2952789 RepID=UPI0039EAF1DB